MIVVRAFTLALALAGCASQNMKDTHAWGDLDRDGCIAYRCQMYCKADATPEQTAAFKAGTVDAEEARQLKRLGGWLAADTATTVAALSLCEAVREANPILGPDPSAFAVIAYNGHRLRNHEARRAQVAVLVLDRATDSHRRKHPRRGVDQQRGHSGHMPMTPAESAELAADRIHASGHDCRGGVA